MYGNKLEFPGGRGVQNKKPSTGGVYIFSGIAHYIGHNTAVQLLGVRRLGFVKSTITYDEQIG